MPRKLATVTFRKYKKRKGNQKWRWIFNSPRGDASVRSPRYYTSRANALRAWNVFFTDAHFAKKITESK